MPRPDYTAILRVLVEHKVDFVVVGGVGAVLQGAPIMTFDLDIVHSTESGNIERLTAALDSLDTGLPLDVLGAIGAGHTYEELTQKAIAIKIADGVTVPVLELSVLVTIKEETAGEKDQAVLPILRQTLRERS
jgi:predicted nucleotidyltransferase